jgi:hypothetical protein
MRHAHHTVLYNKGAQLVFTVALDLDNRPTIPSGAIAYDVVDLLLHEDSADRKFTTAAVAVIDDYSKLTDQLAGRGSTDRKRIQLSAVHASPVVGKRYLISDTENFEVFTLDRLDAGANDLYSKTDLQHGYKIGAAVQGIEIPATIPATLTDVEEHLISHRHFAVDWTFNGMIGRTGTDPSLVREIIRLERRRTLIHLTPADLTRTWQALASTGQRFDLNTACIEAEDKVRFELESNNVWPDERILGSVGKECAKYYALYNLALQMGDAHETQRTEYWGSFHFWLTRLLTGKVPVGTVILDRAADAAPSGVPDRYESRFGRA